MKSFFFFFFSRHYNPWWVLACFTISFHNLLSLHFSLQFLTFIFFKSSSTWSRHLILGLPTGLDEHGSHSVSFLTVLVVSIRITCAAQRNLWDFINLTIFFFLISVSNSSFVFILHVPYYEIFKTLNWDFNYYENLHKTYVKHLNCKLYYQQLHLKYLCNLARYWLQAPWGWHNSDETCRSVIICEIIVHL